MEMYEAKPPHFHNTVTVLTLDEFFDIINGSELPEKWCVEVTKENVKILEDWRNHGPRSLPRGSDIYGYLSVNKVWTPIISDGYTEITTEQFERLVLKLEPKTLPTHWVIRPTNETEGAAVLTWFNANGERIYGRGDEQSYYWHFPAYEPTNHCLISRIHNDNYTEITFAEFQEHVLKENPNKSQPMTKTHQVKKAELEQIHNVACSTWKSKIAELTLRNPFGDRVELTQTEVDEMFTAATESQRPVLVGVFGEPTKGIYLTQDTVDGLELFKRNGADYNTLIAVRCGGEYSDKAFFLNSKFNWEIAKDREGLMCLIPTRK
jgi:hypothetical protein